MITACLDMEGVLFPEIWINVAQKTGIEELKLTTRDISDYDELMNYRIKILTQKKITLSKIQEVISELKPFDGVLDFTDWLKQNYQFIILSDTFYQFAAPLMKQLSYPTLFCHDLIIDNNDMITGYKLRQPNAKKEVVDALKNKLKMKVIAMGDSYNDTGMLSAADRGILFRPPQNVIDEFPQFPVVTGYDEVMEIFKKTTSDLEG